MEEPWRQMGAQLTTDKLAPAILVMQQHILLLKYRRGELHLGGTGSQTFEWGVAAPNPQTSLEPPLFERRYHWRRSNGSIQQTAYSLGL